MAAGALTHAELAIKLVVEGALPMLEGKTPAKMPVESILLDKDEKAKARANANALVVFYPVGDTGVFMQMHDNNMRVWYDGVDTDGVVAALEQAIHRAYPQATMADQQAHPVPDMAVRLYNVPITAKRFAYVEATYPVDRRAKQQFVVRVHAMENV